ncbi:MAG TPA: outer membrane protein transport protein [Pirellulales bacterium]|nr:outer membrane protein transport protein [Pirellulales bacterium]
MSFRRLSALLFLWALISASARTAQADGLIRDGVGPISTGRGGTNLGFADNGAVILDNPGALVNVANNGLFEIGADTVISQVHYTDNKPNDAQSAVRPIPVPNIAYIRRSKDKRWAWGLGVFGPAGFGASYNFQNSFAGPQQYRSFDAVAKVLPTLSYRVTDRLSIGGSVGIAASYLDLEGPLFMPSGALAGAPAIVNLQGFGVAPVGSFGLQYKLSEKTMLGLSFTSMTKFHMGGVMNANIYGVTPAPIYSRFSSSTDINWPRSLGIGLAHKFNRKHMVGIDMIWYDWKHAFNGVGINLTDSSNPMVPLLAGPAIAQTLPINWHDSVSLRLGYQWMPNSRNTYRLGYVYHTSPTPSNTLTPYTDGILLHAFSAGFSHKIGRAYLNAAYQFTFGPTRYVGVSALAGGDFSHSSLHAQAHVASLSLLVPF